MASHNNLYAPTAPIDPESDFPDGSQWGRYDANTGASLWLPPGKPVPHYDEDATIYAGLRAVVPSLDNVATRPLNWHGGYDPDTQGEIGRTSEDIEEQEAEDLRTRLGIQLKAAQAALASPMVERSPRRDRHNLGAQERSQLNELLRLDQEDDDFLSKLAAHTARRPEPATRVGRLIERRAADPLANYPNLREVNHSQHGAAQNEQRSLGRHRSNLESN